jgi:hypothetical protein
MPAGGSGSDALSSISSDSDGSLWTPAEFATLPAAWGALSRVWMRAGRSWPDRARSGNPYSAGGYADPFQSRVADFTFHCAEVTSAIVFGRHRRPLTTESKPKKENERARRIAAVLLVGISRSESPNFKLSARVSHKVRCRNPVHPRDMR